MEIAAILRREFPQTRRVVEAVGDGTSTVSHEITVHELRPGGTVSGPVLMSVADVEPYVARSIDSFQIVHAHGRFWIASLVFDHERPGVPLPAKHLKKAGL